MTEIRTIDDLKRAIMTVRQIDHPVTDSELIAFNAYATSVEILTEMATNNPNALEQLLINGIQPLNTLAWVQDRLDTAYEDVSKSPSPEKYAEYATCALWQLVNLWVKGTPDPNLTEMMKSVSSDMAK